MEYYLTEKYFSIWRENINYRKWRDIQDDIAGEARYAAKHGMESEFWCWACKYYDCDRHRR
jgi:hypothetical protein